LKVCIFIFWISLTSALTILVKDFKIKIIAKFYVEKIIFSIFKVLIVECINSSQHKISSLSFLTKTPVSISLIFSIQNLFFNLFFTFLTCIRRTKVSMTHIIKPCFELFKKHQIQQLSQRKKEHFSLKMVCFILYPFQNICPFWRNCSNQKTK